MKNTFIALIVSLLVFYSHRVLSEDAEVEVLHQWPRGFYGEVSTDIEEAVKDAWLAIDADFLQACETTASVERESGLSV